MIERNLQPYIGINGKDNTVENAVCNDLPNTINCLAKEIGYTVLYGVQTSETTQFYNTENKYGRSWYPVGPQELSGQINSTYNNSLHINFDTLSPEAIPFMTKLVYNNALKCFNQNTHGYTKAIQAVQLNRLPWHSVDYSEAFEKINRAMPLSRLILQASYMQIGNLTPTELVGSLRKYCPNITTILLDTSCGTGKPLDAKLLIPYIDELYGHEQMPAVAIAGGLNPNNVKQLIEPLVNTYNGLSFDAETGLRDNYDPQNPSQSRFSTKKAIEFANSVIQLISEQSIRYS